MAKSSKQHSSTTPPDGAAPTAGQGSAAAHGSQGATDSRERGADGSAGARASALPEAETETLDVAFPPPADVPEAILQLASLVVRAKAERGRRRAGHAFTREETVIPMVDLSAEQVAAIGGDQELVVLLRVPRRA
jgi:hypothetical protein